MSHGNQSRRNYATMDAKLVSLSGRILLGSVTRVKKAAFRVLLQGLGVWYTPDSSKYGWEETLVWVKKRDESFAY